MQSPIPSRWSGKKLADVADFPSNAWHQVEWGNAVLTAEKDGALWLKGDYANFVLDFEYKLDPAANSGAIECDETQGQGKTGWRLRPLMRARCSTRCGSSVLSR